MSLVLTRSGASAAVEQAGWRYLLGALSTSVAVDSIPRVQRNRIHLDVTVSHDEAEARVAAAIEAGGRLVSDAHARSFWVLADVEGNEICVCTWPDRG